MAKRATARAADPAPGLTPVAGDATAPLALDKVIHERVRLAIVSALAVHEMLTFNELKALLETTDGNLSVHARKLEEAGYVACRKFFEGRTRVPRHRPEGGRLGGARGAGGGALSHRASAR